MSENEQEIEEETVADKRKRHDETFKRAKEHLRQYFEKVAKKNKESIIREKK